MTISLILCGTSLVALAVMAMSKQKEISGSKAMFSIGTSSSDSRIAAMWNFVVYMVTHVSVQSAKRITKQAVMKIEKFFITKLGQAGQKFSVVGNMVTGYDLPRNRGSVSFFLKNIEDHKKIMQRAPVHMIK